MGNNEIIGLKSKTRNVLKPLQVYAIIVKGLEKKRREDNGNHGTRRTSYLRGSSSFPQSFGVHNQSKAKIWRVGRDEDRRAVEDYKSCSKRLYQSAQSAPEAGNRPEINKASVGWQWTTNKFAAVRSSARLWKAKLTTLGVPCLFLSYIILQIYARSCMEMHGYAIDRKCAHG